MRYISWTNLQILHFSPLLRHQSCFTTSFPGVSPFINTALCKGVCALWQGQHLYQPLLHIHSSSLNKQINQHHRHNTFLFLSICSVLLYPCLGLGFGWHRGRRKEQCLAPSLDASLAPSSQPVPCSIASQHLSHQATSLHEGASAWGQCGDGNTQPTALPPGPTTLLTLMLLQLATGPPWVLPLCNAIRNCPWNTNVRATWG